MLYVLLMSIILFAGGVRIGHFIALGVMSVPLLWHEAQRLLAAGGRQRPAGRRSPGNLGPVGRRIGRGAARRRWLTLGATHHIRITIP